MPTLTSSLRLEDRTYGNPAQGVGPTELRTIRNETRSGVGTSPGVNVAHATQATVAVPAGNLDKTFVAALNPDGSNFAPTKITKVVIEAAATNTADAEIKASAANGLLLLKDVSDVYPLEPGGIWYGLWPTTGRAFDGTHCSLNFASTVAGSVTVRLEGV